MPNVSNDNDELNSIEDARRLAAFLVKQFGTAAESKADKLLQVLTLLGPMREDFRRELYTTIVALETGPPM